MSVPKFRFTSGDEYAFEKARGMIRMGHTDAAISDYLGMVEEQVATIRRNVSGPIRGRPTLGRTDIAEPLDDTESMRRYQANCQQSSLALARAIGRLCA